MLQAADALETAMSSFLRKHSECYGDTYMKPKHHWACDLAEQFRRDMAVLDAFVIERQHLLVKSIAEHVRNTATYESSVLSGIVNLQIARATDFRPGCRLNGVRRNLAEIPGVAVADTAEVNSFTVSAKDIAFRGTQAAIVVACAEDCVGVWLFVSPMGHVEQITRHAMRVAATSELAVWRPTEVHQALAWREEPSGQWVVIRE